jgi:hypothetical protein
MSVYLAHECCASDGGPHLVVDPVCRDQLPWNFLLLPSLSFSFSSMKLRAPLEVIKLSSAPNFEFFLARAVKCIREKG